MNFASQHDLHFPLCRTHISLCVKKVLRLHYFYKISKMWFVQLGEHKSEEGIVRLGMLNYFWFKYLNHVNLGQQFDCQCGKFRLTSDKTFYFLKCIHFLLIVSNYSFKRHQLEQRELTLFIGRGTLRKSTLSVIFHPIMIDAKSRFPLEPIENESYQLIQLQIY